MTTAIGMKGSPIMMTTFFIAQEYMLSMKIDLERGMINNVTISMDLFVKSNILLESTFYSFILINQNF